MRSMEVYVEHKKTFGFATSSSGMASRSELYGTTLQNAAKLTGDKVRDVKTIDQILGLIIKNGRVDHGPAGNDDTVIAWALSFWLLTHGKNLQHYGINSRDVLVDNKINQVVNNPVTLYHQSEQNYFRSQIESLVEELKKERDTYVIQILERKLKNLANQLSEEDRRRLSVDDLLLSINEQRRVNTNRRY